MTIRPIDIEDPNFNPSHEPGKRGNRRISTAMVNTREFPPLYYFMHPNINRDGKFTNDMMQAAAQFRMLYEAREISGVKAMDPSKEPVDGGGAITDGITDRSMDAAKQLRIIHKTIGPTNYGLLVAVCGQCKMLATFCSEGRATREAMKRLVTALNELSEHLGYKSKGRT